MNNHNEIEFEKTKAIIYESIIIRLINDESYDIKQEDYLKAYMYFTFSLYFTKSQY